MNAHPHLNAARAGFWALVGAVVLLFVFFAALGGIDPAEAQAVTIAVAVLAILWLLHFFRRRATTDEGHLSREDRERRGF